MEFMAARPHDDAPVAPASPESIAGRTHVAEHDPQTYAALLGLEPSRLPRHVAIIMDGNGRWARQQGRPRVEGHARGTQAVAAVVEECCKLAIPYLTLYCLSSENWKRPQQEIDFLMALLKNYLRQQLPQIAAQNIRLRVIGRREGLPPDVVEELEQAIGWTSNNTGLTLCLAINYGGRAEILDAVRAVVAAVQEERLPPSEIDEQRFAANLYTADMPDPDLLIRTAGEMRLSNFLLWQVSYAELWVTPRLWPEFDAALFHEALREYQQRERRFGGLGADAVT